MYEKSIIKDTLYNLDQLLSSSVVFAILLKGNDVCLFSGFFKGFETELLLI